MKTRQRRRGDRNRLRRYQPAHRLGRREGRGRDGTDRKLSTASGSVDLGLARGDVTSSTASGDLDIERYEGTDLDLKSASGSMRVGLPAGTKVALDAQSLSGRIRLPGAHSLQGSAVRIDFR